MTADQFVEGLYQLAEAMLRATCRDDGEIRVGHHVGRSGVFVRARVSARDFADLKYGDALEAMKVVVRRFGEISVDAAGRPFAADLQLFDPTFEETLQTARAIAPREPRRIAVATPPAA